MCVETNSVAGGKNGGRSGIRDLDELNIGFGDRDLAPLWWLYSRSINVEKTLSITRTLGIRVNYWGRNKVGDRDDSALLSEYSDTQRKRTADLQVELPLNIAKASSVDWLFLEGTGPSPFDRSEGVAAIIPGGGTGCRDDVRATIASVEVISGEAIPQPTDELFIANWEDEDDFNSAFIYSAIAPTQVRADFIDRQVDKFQVRVTDFSNKKRRITVRIRTLGRNLSEQIDPPPNIAFNKITLKKSS